MSFLKVVVSGRENTGKSALLNRQGNRAFRRTLPTPGMDFLRLHREPNELRIWDLSGNPGYAEIIQPYFQQAHVLAYCIDLSQPLDPEEPHLKRTFELFRNPGEPEGKIVLIGTKSDLVASDEMPAIQAKLTDLAVAHKCTAAFITSAKDDICQQITEGQERVSPNPTKTCDLFDAISLLIPNPEPLHLLAHGVLEDLITPYPNSDFTKALVRLQDSIRNLSTDQQKSMHKSVAKLIPVLQQEKLTPEYKSLAIVQFQKECLRTREKSKAFNVRHALTAFINTAVVTLLFATVGFAIGFAAGFWSGPGALVSGLLAGHAAACSLTIASVSVGWYSAHRLFKKPVINPLEAHALIERENAIKEAIEDVANSAQQILPKQLSTT